MSRPQSTQGAGALFLSALTVAIFGVLVHTASVSFGVGAQSILRALLAAVFMGIVITFRKSLVKLTKKQFLLVAISGIGTFGTLTLFTVSVNETKVATAAFFIYATGMISSSIIGLFIFKEKATASTIAAVLLSCVGLLIYSGSFTTTTSIVGVLAGIGAGLCDSLTNSLRKTLAGVDRNTIVFGQFAVNAIVGIVFVLITQQELIYHLEFWPVVAIIALAALTLSMGKMLLYGFSYINLNVGSVILATQVFFAVILGALFLHNEPSFLEIAGCSIVFLASTLTLLDSKKYSLPKKSEPAEGSFESSTQVRVKKT